MSIPSRLPLRATALAVCCLFVGCASSGRKIIHTARMSDSSAPPTMSLYKDKGSNNAIIYGSTLMFGVPGLLISSMNVGQAQRRELDKWKAATGIQEDAILRIMNERLRAALERSGKLTFPKSEPVDLIVSFPRIWFGLKHRGQKRFAVLIDAQAAFAKGKDAEYYDFAEEIISTSAYTIEEYQRRPDLFTQGVVEIAEKFGALLAEDYGVPEE